MNLVNLKAKGSGVLISDTALGKKSHKSIKKENMQTSAAFIKKLEHKRITVLITSQ